MNMKIDFQIPEKKTIDKILPGEIFQSDEGRFYLKLREPLQAITLHGSLAHNSYVIVSFAKSDTVEYTVYSESILIIK